MQRGGYAVGLNTDLSENVHPNFVRMGDRVKIRDGVILYGSEKRPLIIGNDVYINARCLLHAGSAPLVIGNRVTLSCGVVIHTDTGPNTSPALQEIYPITAGGVTLEEDVWIGTYVVILPSVRVGHGSVVGAQSVLRSDVPPHSLVVGSPGQVVRTFEEQKARCHVCTPR